MCRWFLVTSLCAAAWLDHLTPAALADPFDQLRANWALSLTGGTNYSLTDSQAKSRLSGLTTTASNYWKTLNKTPGRTYLWSDLASTNDSGQIATAYSRLHAMALAYATYGCALRSNATLAADLQGGLDWMYNNRYNERATEYGNWYDWEIAAPLSLTDLSVLMYDALGTTGLGNSLLAVDHFVPSPTNQGHSGTFTGANLADKIRIVAVLAAVVKDSTKLTATRDALSLLFTYSSSGDGFYADGSFIQHDADPYNGSYGGVVLADISLVLPWLAGSPWQSQDPAQTNAYQWVYRSFEPLLYFGAMMDMTRGRSVSRSSSQDHDAGAAIIQSILKLSASAPAVDAARMRSMVKYWAQVDTYRNFTNKVPLPLITPAKLLMADVNTAPRGELVGHWTFAGMDRVAHLRPGWGLGLSMSSSRIYNYESINSENLQGWFQGDGVTYLYNNDLGQFSNDYWPTINPYRLPGTTVDMTPRANSAGQSYLSSRNWVGGATLYTHGAAGMELNPYNSPLTGKKSWFMFDDEVVCLGAGINCPNGANTQTTIENRKLPPANTNALTVDGAVMPTALGWQTNLPNATWAALDGAGAYYFPAGANVNALREARTNSWSQINSVGPTNLVTETFLTLWFDHGTNPANAGYAYVLLPNFSAAQAANYAAAPEVVILENSTNAQAVKEITSNVVAANFWNNSAKTVDLITASDKASVLTLETPADLSVAVADPTQTNKARIALTLDRSANSVAFIDSAIAILQLRPTIQLSANVNGAFGRSLTAKFNLLNSPPSLAPIADRTVDPGTTILFTNSATDPDLPYQTLTYSLVTAPAGAVINPTNGIFTWRPAVAQAGSTNLISVKVADNGSPSLSATQTFTVVVNEVSSPSLTAVGISNGQYMLSIIGSSGPDYLVEASTNFVDWTTLFTANSPALPFTWTDPRTTNFSRRFYRARMAP